VLCDLRGLILFFIILTVSKTAVYSRVKYNSEFLNFSIPEFCAFVPEVLKIENGV